MASAPAVVLITAEESSAQGQVTERIILHTALGSAAAFIVFAIVLGVVHAEISNDWLNAVVHPLWGGLGAVLIAWLIARLALLVANLLPKKSLAQVFTLVATALLAVGVARMLAVPVFLTLFMMGAMLALIDTNKALSYTNRTAPSSNTAHLRLVTRVSLMSGTRQVALLSQYDTGEWQCGDVFFRLAVSP